MSKIIGNTTATPNPRPDWNQTDETKADYIKNKPDLNMKYDKSGGTINGDVVISGNLDVSGTTTTKDAETLCVKDNIVVANSDGVELINEAGFVVRTDTTNAYGIMYDPIDDGVKIGLGEFDDDGKFNYTVGEDQFLATRDDVIDDGDLVQWDDTAKKFVDTGEKITDYVKFTDYATATKAGVVKVNSVHGVQCDNGDLKITFATKDMIDAKSSNRNPIVPQYGDYFVKNSLTTNNEEWTDDEKKSVRDLIDAVGNTDYAGLDGTAGIIQLNSNKGVFRANLSPELELVSAGETEIKNRTQKYKPITPSVLDMAVKVGVTDNKTELTDEEKTSACEWLGTVKKFENTTSAPYVYTDDKQWVHYLGDKESTYNVRNIPMIFGNAAGKNKPSDGYLLTNNPVNPYHCANKGYVDNLPDNLALTDDDKTKWCDWLGALPIVKETSGFQRVYGVRTTGEQDMFIIDSTLSGAQQGRVPVRGLNGKIYIPTNSIDEDEVAVNRKYVDEAIANAGCTKFYKHSIKLTSASGRLEFITPVSQKGLKDDFYDGDPTMPIKYLSVLPYFNCTISGYPCLSFWRDINEEYACFAGNSNGDVSLVFGVYLDLNDYTIEEI